jgi:hypothetical protein
VNRGSGGGIFQENGGGKEGWKGAEITSGSNVFGVWAAGAANAAPKAPSISSTSSSLGFDWARRAETEYFPSDELLREFKAEGSHDAG